MCFDAFPLVESSLLEETLRVWQRQAESKKSDSKERLTGLMKFLEGKVESEERVSMAVNCFEDSNRDQSRKEKPKKTQTNENKDLPTVAGLLAGKQEKTQRCVFCGQDHENSSCEKAKSMTLDQCLKIIKEKNCCF